MSLKSARATATATQTSRQRSSDICQKLLCVCYYYCRCFGTVSHCIKRCGSNNNKSLQHDCHSGNSGCNNNGSITITTQTRRPQPQPQTQQSRFAFHASEQRALMWCNITIRCLCCTLFFFAALERWTTNDRFYTRLILAQIATIFACPIITVFVQFRYRKRFVLVINALLRLMQCVEAFHADYAIFQWTHVALVALKVMTFVYEIACTVLQLTVYAMDSGGQWFDVALVPLEMYLTVGVLLSLHVTSLFYVCIDALYGALNHYMRHEFVPRLRLNEAQTFGLAASSTNVHFLRKELATFSDLFQRVHQVGLQLHCQWQIPVVTSIIYVYCAAIGIMYFLICLNFMEGEMETRLFVYSVKIIVDIVLLFLTGHRAVKASQLIGCMGLDTVILAENVEWHREMELFLNHINLHEFKLNVLGLFDVSNTFTLTFMSGILTSVCIFIPFTIKAYQMQKFLESRN